MAGFVMGWETYHQIHGWTCYFFRDDRGLTVKAFRFPSAHQTIERRKRFGLFPSPKSEREAVEAWAKELTERAKK